jgi:RND family efflux transporter MFP subunit
MTVMPLLTLSSYANNHNKQQPEPKDVSHQPSQHEEKTDAELSPAQLKQAGIETITIQSQALSQKITAPAEILLNQYKTAYVTPTIASQVKKRLVKLGDQVKKGQKLAVLQTITTPELAANMISIADLEAGLATAKGALNITEAEWKRVKAIGSDLISAKRIDEAKITRDQAAAQVQVYQKSLKKMRGLLSIGTSRNRLISITAPQAGTIIKDNFVLGQTVDSSDILFEISDLSHLWVEAQLKANVVNRIQKDSIVNITVDQQNLSGKVINIGRILDEETKTLAVRIELSAANPFLYPGQFVQAQITSRESYTGIAVPNQAVLRSADGDWMVLVESAQGRFEPKEIEVKQKLGTKTVITGIALGSKIVSKGAFFVQSEIAKSGFEIHNH